jgi:hypothetical protein
VRLRYRHVGFFVLHPHYRDYFTHYSELLLQRCQLDQHNGALPSTIAKRACCFAVSCRMSGSMDVPQRLFSPNSSVAGAAC